MDTITETRRYHAIVRYLSRDGGGVPCSRYGRTGGECAKIAALVDMILSRETGEKTDTETVEVIMDQVVNDSDEPALTIAMHGLEHGIDAREWLGDEELERVIYELIPHYYDDETAENEAIAHGLPYPCEV